MLFVQVPHEFIQNVQELFSNCQRNSQVQDGNLKDHLIGRLEAVLAVLEEGIQLISMTSYETENRSTTDEHETGSCQAAPRDCLRSQ